jgi:hypothetical protein
MGDGIEGGTGGGGYAEADYPDVTRYIEGGSTWHRNVLVGSTATLMLAAGLAILTHESDVSPISAYAGAFTDDGDCLDQTPYDTSEGADLLEHRVEGVDVLTVVPQAANSLRPAVLNFVLAENGEIHHVGDYQTGEFLSGLGCNPSPDGY